MRGLLADVNMEGYLAYLRRLLDGVGLMAILDELGVRFVTFPDLGIAANLDDRRLWHRCPDEGWVLFTDNRNQQGEDSLQATLNDSWRPGRLAVITLSDKDAFHFDKGYAERVASSIADLLYGMHYGEYRDQPRIYVPR